MLINRIKLAKALLALAEISTDKGNLIYEGDLAVGTEVFVEKDGDIVAAEDGEYIAEDKKITVAEGKVAEIEDIVEDEPEEDEEKGEEEFKAEPSKKDKFDAVKAQFEATYQEIQDNIYRALEALNVWGYIIENTNEYAIVSEWDMESDRERLFRYEISVAEDGVVTLGEKKEVRIEYVPVDEPKEDEGQEEIALKDAKIVELETKIAEYEKQLNMSEDTPAKDKVKDNLKNGALRYF